MSAVMFLAAFLLCIAAIGTTAGVGYLLYLVLVDD